MARRKQHRIEDETPIIAEIVADSVISEAAHCFPELRNLGRADSNRLARRQARLYANSPSWRKKMKARGNKGRDTLYAFMRHWLAADVRRKAPNASRSMANAAWYGTPYICPR